MFPNLNEMMSEIGLHKLQSHAIETESVSAEELFVYSPEPLWTKLSSALGTYRAVVKEKFAECLYTLILIF